MAQARLIFARKDKTRTEMKKEMISCEWDMLLDEIPLGDLKIMGVYGAVKKGEAKADALARYGLSEEYYDLNLERVMKT